MSDYLDSQDFYELMQQYRHSHELTTPPTYLAFEAVKTFVRDNDSAEIERLRAQVAALQAERDTLRADPTDEQIAAAIDAWFSRGYLDACFYDRMRAAINAAKDKP